MSLFNLISSADLESSYSARALRQIAWKYPWGNTPLLYLLSLMDKNETDKPKFDWYEGRQTQVSSTTITSGAIASGGAGPFANAANSASEAAAGFTWTADTVYNVYVTSNTRFRVDDVIWLRRVPNAAATAYLELKGIVTEVVDGSTTRLKVMALVSVASVSNDTDAQSIDVVLIGKAAPEGDTSRSGGLELPIEPENYTQIFREAFDSTGTALKAGMEWDETGPYKTMARQNMFRICEAMEGALYFGVRKVDSVVNQRGKTVPRRFTGGLLWFLEQWEKGNTGNGGAFDYRPNGIDLTAVNWETNNDKRIIKINGSMSIEQFEIIMERAFMDQLPGASEKLMQCGNGFMSIFQKYCKAQSITTRNLQTKEDSYGMSITRWTSPWGELVLKTHPMWNRTQHNQSAFVVDVPCLEWRDLTDRELTLLANRQGNDEDCRRDEWLGEGGLQCKFPENHLYVEGVTSLTY